MIKQINTNARKDLVKGIKSNDILYVKNILSPLKLKQMTNYIKSI